MRAIVSAAVLAGALLVPGAAASARVIPHPALDRVHQWAWATQSENRQDRRPVVRYHWGPDDPQVTARQRWRVAVRWYRRYRHALAQRPLAPAYPWSARWYDEAMCVHGGEGAWDAIDPSGTYFGGMQFDIGTWLSNGGGQFASRADWASPVEQLIIAFHTWQARGWSPWPNTAAACGLL